MPADLQSRRGLYAVAAQPARQQVPGLPFRTMLPKLDGRTAGRGYIAALPGQGLSCTFQGGKKK